jgi:hypothetical protein
VLIGLFNNFPCSKRPAITANSYGDLTNNGSIVKQKIASMPKKIGLLGIIHKKNRLN